MTAFTEKRFENKDSIDPLILEGLIKLKKRVYVVGKFNNSDDVRGRLFAFTSPSRRSQLESVADLSDVLTCCEPNEQAFFDSIRPIVAEWVQPGFGPTIGTKFPAEDDRKKLNGYKEIVINSYSLMYDGDGQQLSPSVGERVLVQLEAAADAYIGYAESQRNLLELFNELLYAFQKTNKLGYNPMLAKKDLYFPPDFQEAFFQYLLFEDPKKDFNLADAMLPAKMKGMKATKFVKAGVREFRNQILSAIGDSKSKSNKISTNVRESFQKQRKDILQGIKLLQSRVMMGAIPTWQFSLLFGKHPDEISQEKDPQFLLSKLHGKTEQERKIKIRNKETTLAKPIRQVSQAIGDRLASGLRSELPKALNAFIHDDKKGIDSFEKLLKTQGLKDDQIASVSERLRVLRDICNKSAEEGKDEIEKKSLFEEAASELIDSFIDELDQDFLRFLVGVPIVTGEMFKAAYVKRCRSRYMRAVSLVSGTTGKLQSVSVEERKKISDEIEEIENKLPIDRLLSKFLSTASLKLSSEIADEYLAIGIQARIRTRELWGEERESLTKSHSTATATELTGVVDKQVTGSDIVQEAEIELQQHADGSVRPMQSVKQVVKPDKAAKNSSKKEAGNKTPPQLKTDTKTSFRERLIQAARSSRISDSEKVKEPSEEELVFSGAKIIAEHCSNAAAKVKKARSKGDKMFLRKDREIALREIAMSRKGDLYFEEEYSTLIELALDAVACGSNSPEEFFKKFPMSKYFPLESVDQVRDWYLRLWHMLKESCVSLEKHISEVRALSELIEKCQSAIRSGAELYVYNGSASDFVNWVSENGDGNQFWLAESVKRVQFLAPSAVCVLESALMSESRFEEEATEEDANEEEEDTDSLIDGEISSQAASFLSGIKSATELSDSRIVCPIILFGPCDPLNGRNGNWYGNFEDIGTAIDNDLNGLCYVVGPAIRRGAKQKSPLAEITIPTSLAVVEKLLSNKCTYMEAAEKADRSIPKRGFVNLASKGKPVGEMIDSFCSDKKLFPAERNADNFASMRVTLFAQYVQWLHDSLHWETAFDERTWQYFQSTFQHLTAESNEKKNQTRYRKAVSKYLNVLGADSDELQIAFEESAVAFYLDSNISEVYSWMSFPSFGKEPGSSENED